MSEGSPQQHGGLPPNFSLEEAAAYVSPPPGDGEVEAFDDHHAVVAAQAMFEKLYTDPKTGLHNEEGWRNRLRETVKEIKPGDELTVTMGDVNGFKAVNDELGHPAGDELLGLIGQALSQAYVRKTDFLAHGSREDRSKADSGEASAQANIARLGGDEFSISTYVTAEQAQERKRRAVSADKVDETDNERVNRILAETLKGTRFEKFNISLALGTAQYQAGDSVETVFARADLKMFEVKYQAKIESVSNEDRKYLRKNIPIFEGLGQRVNDWLKIAAGLMEAAPVDKSDEKLTDAA